MYRQGAIGNQIEAPVVVVRIVLRKNWKASRDGVRRDLYILQGKDNRIYTITMPHHNAIKVGEEFVVRGTIKSQSVFLDQKQTHLVAYSLQLKQRK